MFLWIKQFVLFLQFVGAVLLKFHKKEDSCGNQSAVLLTLAKPFLLMVAKPFLLMVGILVKIFTCNV